MRALLLVLTAVGALTLGGCGSGAAPGSGGPDSPGSDASAAARPGPAKGGVVSGRVLGADGKPVAGALVTPVGIGDAPAVPELAVSTGADGTYRWYLAPGTYRITVTPAGASTVEGGTVTLAAGGTETVDVRLP